MLTYVVCLIVNTMHTGIGPNFAAYSLSPGTLIHDFWHGKPTNVSLFSDNTISNFVLHNQSVQSAHKYSLCGELAGLAVMRRQRC